MKTSLATDGTDFTDKAVHITAEPANHSPISTELQNSNFPSVKSVPSVASRLTILHAEMDAARQSAMTWIGKVESLSTATGIDPIELSTAVDNMRTAQAKFRKLDDEYTALVVSSANICDICG